MNVLFVCHGNINRSAAAEIISQQLRPDLTVKSCGVKTWPGRITAKKTRQTLEERGYNGQGIRSTPIDQQLVDWADRIYLMDGGNSKRYYQEWNKPAEQLATLTQAATRIPDPTWCRDRTQHHQMIDLLEEAVKSIPYE